MQTYPNRYTHFEGRDDFPPVDAELAQQAGEAGYCSAGRKKAADSVRNASEDTPEFLRKYSEKLETLSGEEAENFKRENPIPEFLRKCSDFSEKDFLDSSSGAGQENAKKSLRYEYLMKKYGIGRRIARYEYLMEKHK